MKTPRDYFFEVIKKKGDIEIRSSITAQINEEDFIRVMEEYANLKVNAVLPQANVSGRSELLFAFIAEVKKEFADQNWDYLDFIAERVLKANNSH